MRSGRPYSLSASWIEAGDSPGFPAAAGRGAGSAEQLQVTYLPLSALKPRERNPRTHTKKQIRQIADSIQQFGFTNPVLLDRQGGIIAGHGRVAAAKLLGLGSVPTIRFEAMTEAQVRAYVIADNKLAENAGWDREILAIEFQCLTALELDFDLTVTGFETAEIDLLLDEAKPAAAADQVPTIDDRPAVSRLGDLWILGRHRLLCGDATQAEAFARLMAGQRAQLVFTDPPYNVPVDGHVCGLGGVKHEEFAMAAGEMSEAEFTAFLTTVFQHLAASSSDGSIHFVCMDWRHMGELLASGRAVYAELKNLCIWNKTNGGMGSLYRSKHELVFVFKSGTAPHVNNVELGRFGRYRTNVWDYAGINALGAGRAEALAMHPTVKPVQLVADAILDCSDRGGVVLDCFLGSGTTLIAAEQVGRRCFGLELDPKYVDLAIQRYRDLTGDDAVLAETGQTFAAVQSARMGREEVRDGR